MMVDRWVVVVVALIHTATVAAPVKFVDLIQDGFDHYYKIYGYSMNDTAEYRVVAANSTCECRRKCQVVPRCSSVTVLPLEGGMVECRVSNKPGPLSDTSDRPKLYRTPGAFHFLSAATTNWVAVEADGYKYRVAGNLKSWASPPSWCVNIMAAWRTPHMPLVLLNVIPANYHVYIDLSRVANGPVTWKARGDAVLYEDTGLDPALLQDLPATQPSKFYAVHDGSQVTLMGDTGTTPRRILCQDNPLNLQW
ncbi:uncharacterized protein LOC121864113 [Homarus americanus]|uniref:Uncharacterized protein n=1 Tax=Homarus americanus TaxID=6706 RepID=A0A8J5NDY3_HOMAM|nr:uncharacterized protein LOC121864113 [Homarus americanus]KAG7177489.1 hypothetical protein Hamer_G025508 [Homarus americanus]